MATTSRVERAENVSETTAARTPGTLFATMLMPIPVPHTSRPQSAESLATACNQRRQVPMAHRVPRRGTVTWATATPYTG
jgi:hypothetical protein